ncbi:PGF-CTERM sorting domain-containing protein [Haloarcula sp. CBA1130]|uniref:PGF-CTERM sorting domain-containing protein n=1 Tax=unclassified Haloarcula TaxID=2624677 RepID=UPI00124878E0|nr:MULTISPECIES: PGF-CTERM sorting domain-containing protein [unclassified Haloarcula]KAA9397849.1 PGF-CTERM sorting domain-containing protein [Haloarcula sp. CBA1129]KAA9402462.1 PGF-CTERM sorting domain-containing protein [Haloarcula sp. CBA1130]
MYKPTKGKRTVICAITVLLVLAAPLSVTSAATPVADGQTTAVTENVDVWERSLLPLRTSSTGPTAIAAPETYINIESAQTGDVPLNREEYTIHETGESVDLTFESTTGAGTTGLAGDEAQLLAVRLSESPDAAGFSDGSVRTDLASIFTNDSNANSVELLDDAEGVGSIDDNGVLETSYTPDSGGAYGFILVTVDDGQGLSVSDNNVSADGNVTVVGVEQTLVQESPSTVDATSDDVAVGDNISLDIETELEDDSVTHAVLVFDEDELQQRTSTVRVTGDIDENFSEDQVTVENSFDGVNGVSSTDDDASLIGEDSTTAGAMPSAGLVGLFGFVLSEASPESTGDDVMHASATTVSGPSDTTVDVETLDSWPNGTYTYVHIAVGEDSNEINSATGTVTLSQSNETDGDSGGDDDDNNSGGGDDDDNNSGGGDDDDNNSGGGDDGDNNSGGGDSGDDNSDSEGTEDEVTTEGEDQTATDDGTETVETEDEDEQTETATTAGGGGAQQPDNTDTTGTEGSIETTSSSGPGFTVLVAVLALLGAGFLARRN